MKLSRIFAAMLGLAVSMLATSATATTIPSPLFTFTTAYLVDLNNYNIGNEFQTGQQLYVSKIGAFIAPSEITSGLTNVEYNAFLYASDRTTVLASAVIPAGTLVDAQSFAYVPLTYTLLASTNYVLTSHTSLLNSTSAYTYNGVTPAAPTGTWNLGTTLVQNWYDVGGFGTPNNHTSPYQEFMGGNLLVANELPVPEPSTLCLLGLGVVGMVAKNRRRRAAA